MLRAGHEGYNKGYQGEIRGQKGGTGYPAYLVIAGNLHQHHSILSLNTFLQIR
jgi:hypothetical protein